MFCPTNSSSESLWVNGGFSICYFDSITSLFQFVFMMVFGSFQIWLYIKFSSDIDREYLHKSLAFKLQYFFNFAMMLEAFIRFAVETTIIDKNKFYGYLILQMLMGSIAWIISLILIYVESCKALPSIPTRGHGVILLIFWTSSFVIENLAFVSFKSSDWFWKFKDQNDQIRFSLWLSRFILTLFCLLFGILAPGIPKRRYGLVIEAPESQSLYKKLKARFGLFFRFLWTNSNWSIKFNLFVCLFILVLQRVTGILSCIFSKLLIDEIINLRGNNSTLTIELSGQTSNIFYSLEPYKLPLIFMMLFSLVLFLDGKFIHNGFLTNLRTILWLKIKEHLYLNISKRLYFSIQKLSISWHLTTKPEDSLKLVKDGAESVDGFFNCLIFELVPIFVDIIIAVMYFVTLFNMWFGILIFMSICIYLTITVYIGERRALINAELLELKKKYNQKSLETIRNIMTVKYNATEDLETEKHGHLIVDFQQAEQRTLSSLWLLNLFQNLIMNVSLLIGSIYCCWLIITKDGLTTGDFVLYASFLLKLYSDFGNLGSFYKIIKKSFNDMDIVLNLLAQELRTVVKTGNDSSYRNLEVRDGVIKFENVTLEQSYETPLSQISFTVSQNQKLAITGLSSQERIKFLGLFYKLFYHYQGTIKFDGQDIKMINDDSLRKSIGLISLNDSLLFNEDFEYNITYGKLGGVDGGDVEQAARFAGIHDKILASPFGYKTQLNNKVYKLHDQDLLRIVIAKVCIQNPRYLIIDYDSFKHVNSEDIERLVESMSSTRTTVILLGSEDTTPSLTSRGYSLIMKLKEGRLFVDNDLLQ